MGEANRMRCANCGAAYTGHTTADDVEKFTCRQCGATELYEEDPEGLVSGAFPPAERLLPLAAAMIFSLLAVWFPLLALLALGFMICLAVEIQRGHRQQRADRISLWDRLRRAYSSLSKSINGLKEELDQTKASLAEVSARYSAISPERRERLAGAIATQQETLGILGDIAVLKAEKDRLGSAIEEFKARIVSCEETLGVHGDIAKLKEERDRLGGTIQELKARIVSFEEEELFQSLGFYAPLYDCVDSEAYRLRLDRIRETQKAMVKADEALRVEAPSLDAEWVRDKKIAKGLQKLVLRAFNGECDATIEKVTFSNLEAIQARITKSHRDLNDLCQAFGITIVHAYLKLKLEELHLCYEYQMKRKEEREEERKIREQMREDARVMKEIEEDRKKVEKEETHFNRVIAELKERMEAAAEAERELYQKKLKEYEEQLAVVLKDKEEVAFREQSTRAGWVYVISNIGSFGEDVYKIGVSRRKEPQERIDELGDASVPFGFDVHAMIFSADAPKLEGALHEHFADRNVNKVNPRKEFFRVTLHEIEEVVKAHHDKTVEFRKLPKAEEYRQTLAFERARAAGQTPRAEVRREGAPPE